MYCYLGIEITATKGAIGVLDVSSFGIFFNYTDAYHSSMLGWKYFTIPDHLTVQATNFVYIHIEIFPIAETKHKSHLNQTSFCCLHTEAAS